MARLNASTAVTASIAQHLSDHNKLHAKANYVFDVTDYGAEGDGSTDDSAAIQGAIDAAEAASPTGTVFFPSLQYSIATGLTILDCDVHALPGAELLVDSSITGITVGSSSASCDGHVLRLPHVTASIRDWDSTPTIGTQRGVVFAAADHCEVWLGDITGFSYGLVVEGDAQGVAYNTFMLGKLVNNAVNLYVNAVNSGWANQNTFIGGNQVHSNIGGSPPYAGVRNTQVDAGNYNLFLGCSLEGGFEEYLLDCSGTGNRWVGCRWEVAGNPQVRWGATARSNIIDGGYDSSDIESTVVSGARDNNILGENRKFIQGANAGPFVALRNSSSDAWGLVLYPAATDLTEVSDLTTDYGAKFGSAASGFKAPGDAEDRIFINHSQGRIFFGDGSTDPSTLAALRYAAGFLETNYPIRVEVGAKIFSGSGTPEGSQAATVGSVYMRTDGGSSTSFYVKESGTGNTGWVAK